MRPPAAISIAGVRMRHPLRHVGNDKAYAGGRSGLRCPGFCYTDLGDLFCKSVQRAAPGQITRRVRWSGWTSEFLLTSEMDCVP